MHYIKKISILFIFCSVLAACSEQPLTKAQKCLALERQITMNQYYEHNYSSGVQNMRINNFRQQYQSLGCKK